MNPVERARIAAMSDIVLLRALVRQQSWAGVQLIFDTLPNTSIILSDNDAQKFYVKMTTKKAEISVEDLVGLYNSLEQCKETRPQPIPTITIPPTIWRD